ncbi:MAG: response regulator transcription factor [Oscillospiraceae bacterium]|nr:response regulator transcription factor [Oscillospiraceae bacterium]
MIWCVEDDAGIRDIELYALRSAGYEAQGFADGDSFRQALRGTKPALVILDVMLPGTDGVELLRRMKASADDRAIPVIMATAKGAEYDKVQSLDLGADDYIVKPFGIMEFLSRVRAVLRRCGEQPQQGTLRAGGVAVDPERRTVEANGRAVELTRREFELLRLLMAHPGTVFTRGQLLSEVWGVDYCGETRTVDMHMRTLRRKLGECAGMLGTVRGVGYKLETKS